MAVTVALVAWEVSLDPTRFLSVLLVVAARLNGEQLVGSGLDSAADIANGGEDADRTPRMTGARDVVQFAVGGE